jgi:hypothetical protein
LQAIIGEVLLNVSTQNPQLFKARTIASRSARLSTTVYDISQAEGRLFIAMGLVRGHSLQQIIAESPA